MTRRYLILLSFFRFLSLPVLLVISVFAWAQQETINYCIDPNWAPYEALRNGEHIGISRDYLDRIEKRTDFDFQLVPTDSLEQSLTFVREGQCQMLTMLNTSPSRATYLDFSIPYFEAPNVLVAKKGSAMVQGLQAVQDELVGVVEGYRHAEYLARNYPEVRVKTVESEARGLVRLSRGEFDLMIGSLLSVYSGINSMKLDDLVIVGYAEPYDSLSFAVTKNMSDKLLPLMNDQIRKFPEHQKVEIYKRWSNVKSVDDTDVLKPFLIVLVVALIGFGIILRKRVVGSYTQQLKQKSKEIESLQGALLEKNRTLEFLSNHDALTGLYNRNHVMHRAEEEVSRFQRFHTPPSLIIAEIDNLSELHAAYGAKNTDDILKTVAGVCLSTVREVDVVARWSGEQFLILCPQTDIASAEILAQRLLKAMAENDELCARQPNTAVGIGVLRDNESFTDWFDRTAKALYQSKRLGYGVACAAE